MNRRSGRFGSAAPADFRASAGECPDRRQHDTTSRRLPIDDVLPEVITALRRSPSVVLRAPTGAGKTTRVPPAVLDSGLAGGRKVLLLQPRRLAARAAARRIAWERNARIGEEIGYQVRFDRQSGPATRIEVLTEGILIRMLQDDPFLSLAMVRRVQQTVHAPAAAGN